MVEDLEERIDQLYAGPLEAFVPERTALAKARAAAGDPEGAARVRALRKPVVSAWALNRLAREEPDAVRALVALGDRLRTAQHRAISGRDVELLRRTIEERRRAVTALVRMASRILEEAGVGTTTHRDDLAATLEAAAAVEEAGELVRSGRVVRPLRPPSGFGEQGLRVLEGGRPPAPATGAAGRGGDEPDPQRVRRRRELERELADAERRERSAAARVDRARSRLQALDAKRAEARDGLKAAEAEHRGARIDAKRLAAAVAKLEQN
ncbi:MAG TPA: hypothetical protein VE669_10760 [Actinomycetota bacterium]|nr:hypothetical protein [Actinomycetota bacterium]